MAGGGWSISCQAGAVAEPEQSFLTTEQVAARLGVKASRVRQLVGQGRLTPLATGLRAHLFTSEAVAEFERYLAEMKQTYADGYLRLLSPKLMPLACKIAFKSLREH